MNIRVCFLLTSLQLSTWPAAAQIAGHAVISEVYGSGGNIGGVYRNDFVELYNPTPYPVSLAGWSVQYASATGTGTWHAAALGGTILPYGFYLLQLAGGSNGTPLPPADTTGGINMSATAGKVALVSVTTLLGGATPGDSTIVDMVGYGAANGFEGSGPAPAPGTETSIERKAVPAATGLSMAAGGSDFGSGNGWDSNNNASDFVVQTSPNPQNTSSAAEHPPDDALPIRFGSLNASTEGISPVLVSWTTLCETACYGFIVERSSARTGGYVPVSGLIPGHGTTLLTHAYACTDPGGAKGLFYRVKEIDTNGAEWLSESVEAGGVASAERIEGTGFLLRQNFPNPFNPGTRISYRLAEASDVKIAIFDILGRDVRTLEQGKQTPGDHMVQWDAAGVPAGVYFCRLEAGKLTRTIRLVLIK